MNDFPLLTRHGYLWKAKRCQKLTQLLQYFTCWKRSAGECYLDFEHACRRQWCKLQCICWTTLFKFSPVRLVTPFIFTLDWKSDGINYFVFVLRNHSLKWMVTWSLPGRSEWWHLVHRFMQAYSMSAVIGGLKHNFIALCCSRMNVHQTCCMAGL